MNSKPTKRIAIVDAGKDTEFVEAVLAFIAPHYSIQYTKDRNADYVFHSCFGYDILKYTGIRVFVTGENISPDFNISDYALGFDPLQFGDRYRRLPLLKLFPEAYAALCAPRPNPDDVVRSKTGFCAYVMSNTKNSAGERIEIFDALSAYKPIASGGKWRNNVGGPVKDKIAFQSTYKFILAIENDSSPGYLTEKFAQAAQSNAVPIYWGDSTVSEQLNPKAFINCHDFENTDALVDHVRQIDQDDDTYLEMLGQPWFIDSREPEEWSDDTYVGFLSNILDQPLAMAFRRNRSRWGMKYEKRYFDMAFRPFQQMLHLLKKASKKK
tara:strand:+ start:3523 stop:4497 length:975 start_codon:yes stop_codon:yes gene_type:complete